MARSDRAGSEVGMTFASVVLALVGIVHLVPATGVRSARLAALYGVAADGDVAVLLRHRAVLFGVLGAACLAAAVRPEWQAPVLIAALVSTGSFVGLARSSPGLRRILGIDAALSVLLIAALWTG